MKYVYQRVYIFDDVYCLYFSVSACYAQVFEMLTQLFESVQDKMDAKELFSRVKKASSSFRKGKSPAKRFYSDVESIISDAMRAKYAKSTNPSQKEKNKILLKTFQFMDQLMPGLADTIPERISEGKREERREELLAVIREGSRIHARRRQDLEDQEKKSIEYHDNRHNENAPQERDILARSKIERSTIGGAYDRRDGDVSSCGRSRIANPAAEAKESQAKEEITGSQTNEQATCSRQSSEGERSETKKGNAYINATSPCEGENHEETKLQHGAAAAHASTQESICRRKHKKGDTGISTASVDAHKAGSTHAASQAGTTYGSTKALSAINNEETSEQHKPSTTSNSISGKLQEFRANAANVTLGGNLPQKTDHSYLYDYPVASVPYDKGVLEVSMYEAQIEKDPETQKDYVSYIFKCEWGPPESLQDESETSQSNPKVTWLISRRYREFDALHEEIKAIIDDYVASRRYFGKESAGIDPSNLPSLPKKTWFKGTEPTIIADRKLGLSRYVKDLLEKFPLVLHMNPVDEFFSLTDRLRGVRRQARRSVDDGLGSGHSTHTGSLVDRVSRKLDQLRTSPDALAIPPFWEPALAVYADYGVQVLGTRSMPEEREDIIRNTDMLKAEQSQCVLQLITVFRDFLERAGKVQHRAGYLRSLIFQMLRCEAFVALKYIDNSIQEASAGDPEKLFQKEDQESGDCSGAARGGPDNRTARLVEEFCDQQEKLQKILAEHEDEITAIALARQYSVE